MTGDYLKVCSSVLGRGYVPGKFKILISDKLDLNVLLANDKFESFKKGANTVCDGYMFQA